MVTLTKTLVGGKDNYGSLLEADALNVSDVAKINSDASFDQVFTLKTLKIRFFVVFGLGLLSAHFPPISYIFTNPDSSFTSLNSVLRDVGKLAHPVVNLALSMYLTENVRFCYKLVWRNCQRSTNKDHAGNRYPTELSLLLWELGLGNFHSQHSRIQSRIRPFLSQALQNLLSQSVFGRRVYQEQYPC
jgi:hypothetical protein